MRGVVVEHVWSASRIYPGTSRRYRVYVPAQYSGAEPAALMVFQDGHAWADPAGPLRVPLVFDDLIDRREMPVTIGVFVDPGIFEAELPAKLGWDPKPANRSAEYDAFDDTYASFLLAEILPPVLDRYRIADDPDRWAIAGGSSGGSCAFTVAWHRPDRFRRVLSFLGSFPQLADGARLPELIARTPRKPLRVFLLAATRDLGWDDPERSWLSSNRRVAAALAERDYDVRLAIADGGHDPALGAAILPDALQWLWRQSRE